MKDINYLKQNGINVESVMDVLGSMEMYDEILSDFLNGDVLAKLIKYKEAKDMPNYSIVVHNLKGECLYLGMEKLAHIAFEHQIKSEANDINYINNNFEILTTELRRVITVAKTYLAI